MSVVSRLALPPGVEIMGEVVGLEDARIMGPCVLGHPTRDGDAGPLVLGPGTVVRAFAVLYQGVTLGAAVQIGHGAMIREGNVVGDRSSVGTNAVLEPANTIGQRSRVHTGGFLSSVTLGDDVFCGPHVVFTDDPHPPCPRYLECVGGATVEDGVAIGARTVILPGVRLGRDSLIGAGSVVTKDVPTGAVAVGSPAKVLGQRNELSCSAGLFDHAYAWLDEPARREH